jgi:hypothetical protein
MKAKSLSLAFIYFLESGLLNGLPEKSEKFSDAVSGCMKNVSNAFVFSFLSRLMPVGGILARSGTSIRGSRRAAKDLLAATGLM